MTINKDTFEKHFIRFPWAGYRGPIRIPYATVQIQLPPTQFGRFQDAMHFFTTNTQSEEHNQEIFCV